MVGSKNAPSEKGDYLMRFQKHIWKVALFLLFILFMVAVLAPWIAPYDPQAIDLSNKIQGISGSHWLGTDYLGRDVLSRLMYGARYSLLIALSISIFTVLVGGPIGLLVGWYGGRVGSIFSWFISIILAFPTFLLALALAGIFGQGIVNLILAITLVGWVNYARLLRNMVEESKQSAYVTNAKLMGASTWYILRKHILPFVYRPVLVVVLLDIGALILMISGFSFLGVGVQPSTPEWGMMINDARPYFRSMPGLLLYPGLAISFTVICFILVGEYFDKKGEIDTWRF